jgi:predicted transposase YdaD
MAARARPRNAHDRVVKRVFSRKAAFAVELRHVLPAELLTHLDLRTLAKHSTERTDDHLRGRISDLCFTAGFIGGQRRLPAYFPLEHHSTFAGLLPLRAITSANEIWNEYIADHPSTKVLPFIAPILFTQPAARNTPVQLSQILDVPLLVGAHLLPPFEARVFTDDLSGSVLDDPHADPATLALVELTRALLHAHENPASLTRERLATLARLFEMLLDQPGPLATNDVRALMTYVHALEEGSPVRELIASALRGRSRKMYASGADALVAKGKKKGLAEGRRAGLSEGRRAGLSEGRRLGQSEGLARAVLEVLALRSLKIPASRRKRVSSCRDEQRLRRWLERAITATSSAEIFDEE